MAGPEAPVLLLFDIDHTLVHTSGTGMRSLCASLEEVAGLQIQTAGFEPGGKTDPAILRELLNACNYEPEGPWEVFEQRVWASYERRLHEELTRNLQEAGTEPGVPGLLAVLEKDDRFRLALLTGNREPGARIKLEPFGLNDYFPVGGFGSDDMVRERLGPVALRRAQEYYQSAFDASRAWVIGDTSRDVAAGKALGARTLAIATGHQSEEELWSTHPTCCLPTLEDTARVLYTLSGASGLP